MSRRTRSGDDFTAMLEEFFAKNPSKWWWSSVDVPSPPEGCQVRRINEDGSITYVSRDTRMGKPLVGYETALHPMVKARLGDRMCNVWRDYYDQYGYRHTMPEPDGDV